MEGHLLIKVEQLGLERIGSPFTWAGKDYIIREASYEIDKNNNETGYIFLTLETQGAPEGAGPTN